MWSDEELKQYTRDCIQKYPHTPSGIVLKSYYVGNDTIKGEVRFRQQRAIVEREIQIFSQKK